MNDVESGTTDQEILADPEADEQASELPLAALLPGYVLGGLIVLAWLSYLPRGMVMFDWAISADMVRHGDYSDILLHMFAHAGPMHLLMNASVLLAVAGPIQYRMGATPSGWARFALFYFLAGMAGLALYLAINPSSAVPMLGASGAIYGLIGFIVRWPPFQNEAGALFSNETRVGIVDFVKGNLILIILLTLPALLAGKSGGVAWEGHLGGFLFGLLAAPWFGRSGIPADEQS